MRTGFSDMSASNGMDGANRPLVVDQPRFSRASIIPGCERDIQRLVNMDDSARPIVDLRWAERGIPAIPVMPAQEGFGRKLIEEALPHRLGATFSLEFPGGGIHCCVTMPHIIRGDRGPSTLKEEDGR
ncbi:MAG TPA: hypothetical protein VN110_00325 [Sphingobium sp.]|nr:hypothetical protein [Sphingobium sp.]